MTEEVRRTRQRKRWPIGAEWARQAAVQATEEARKLISSSIAHIAAARERLARNPRDPVADTMLADAAREEAEALVLLADIQRWLSEARNGEEA